MFIDIHTHHVQENCLQIVNFTNGLNLENCYYSYGIHPENLAFDFDLKLAQNKNCVALGELGLDKRYSNFKKQLELTEMQFEIAEEFELPVIIHCVNAWSELIALKQKSMSKVPCIIHGFRKTKLLSSLLQNDFYISIENSLLYEKSLQEILINIPLEKLFFETDDTEIHVKEIYECAAKILNLPIDKLIQQIENNFKKVFTKCQIG